MPYFKARHRNASYSVVADKINQVIIPMSFDTGAVNTVISLSAYYNKSIDAAYIKWTEECITMIFRPFSFLE